MHLSSLAIVGLLCSVFSILFLFYQQFVKGDFWRAQPVGRAFNLLAFAFLLYLLYTIFTLFF